MGDLQGPHRQQGVPRRGPSRCGPPCADPDRRDHGLHPLGIQQGRAVGARRHGVPPSTARRRQRCRQLRTCRRDDRLGQGSDRPQPDRPEVPETNWRTCSSATARPPPSQVAATSPKSSAAACSPADHLPRSCRLQRDGSPSTWAGAGVRTCSPGSVPTGSGSPSGWRGATRSTHR